MQHGPSDATRSRELRVLFMGTYVPRECGIATYAEDVIRAVEPHGATCRVLAMERPGMTLRYDARVVGTVMEHDRSSYLAAADLVNSGDFDILSLQHEFGIYGGDDADHLVFFLEAVRIPTVVTFHTILREPGAIQRRVQREIAARASGIVVMNGLALDVLRTEYGVDTRKVSVVHHGAPIPPCERRGCTRTGLGMRHDELVISTFGLLAPVKGLEYVVQAMPRVVASVPNAVYYVLGQTHPVVREDEGESYRELLRATARDLGVEAHVRFVDRYLSKDELMRYLVATDTYVTPYTNLEQVTSGTLAYAMAAGCPVVATPYPHAQFMLAQGEGLLVPPRDPAKMADAIVSILADPEERARMEQTNWAFGRNLYWPQVGAEYLHAFRRAATP